MGIMRKLVWHLSIVPRMRRLKKLLPQADVYPTGSRYICDPPYLWTDVDFLIYSKTDIDSVLLKAGYEKSVFTYNANANADDFDAWRKGKENLIVTQKKEYADSFVAATYWCRERNILSKGIRVYVHECFRGNNGGVDHPGCFSDVEAQFLNSLTTAYGRVLVQAYRAKHGLNQ